MDTSGFYKLDLIGGGLLFAPNFVDTPNFSMSRADTAHSTVAQDGWIWFDVDAKAYNHFSINPNTQPWNITAVQAKIALHNAGLLSLVEVAISGAPISVQLAWDNTAVFARNSPTLELMRASLGWSNNELDALFLSAMEIIV